MSRIPRLIGLYAPAPQSGKTTVANYLNGCGYRILPFAAPIKHMVRTFLMQLGHTPAELDFYLDAGKEILIPSVNVTPRHLMQTLGTEWGRSCISPGVWLTCWERVARSNLDRDIDVVVDDVRFPNEAALVRKLGGELWRIERPGTARGTEHASEGGLDAYPYFDRRIVNDRTLVDLHNAVRRVVAPDSVLSP